MQSTPATPGPRVDLLHHTFRRAGGMERYALVLCEALRSLGCQIVVHARNADAELARQVGVELDLLTTPNWPRKLRDWRFFRRVEACRPQLNGLQVALSRVRARDLVVCGGTHRGYLSQAKKLAGPFDMLQIWLERQAYHSARRVVSHSDLCTRELRQLYHLSQEKILTLYPPVEARFAPARPEARPDLRQRFGFPANKPVLLFPSMGHRRKGLQPILAALEPFADHVILAVAGKPGGVNRGFVRALGYVDDMVPLYQAADFTILGSYYEPFGLVGPESVLCGTRLIFDEQIGCLSAIDKHQVLGFSVWDSASIRRAVERALEMFKLGDEQHRVPAGHSGLRYDPDPIRHARELLAAAGQT